ncbi:hypothetical protein [Romboutsia weinsteinii]|nr:hypothetical protein [Romboutsia weinsteinii]
MKELKRFYTILVLKIGSFLNGTFGNATELIASVLIANRVSHDGESN